MASRTSEREPQNCPVCGATASVEGLRNRWVACDGPSDKCGVYGPSRPTSAAAIAAWNGLRYGAKPAKGSCPWCLQPPAKSVGHPCKVERSARAYHLIPERALFWDINHKSWRGPPLKPGESMDMLIVAAPKKKIDIPLRPLLQEVFARIDRKKRIRAGVVAELQRRKLAAPKPAKPKRKAVRK